MTYAQFSNDLESNDQKVGERTRKYITAMPAFKYMYVNKPSFGFYSKLGLGLMFMNLKEKDTQSGLQRYLHEDGIVVGIGHLGHVVGEALERGVVEDVVDADGLLASEGAHPTAATLLETVDHIA